MINKKPLKTFKSFLSQQKDTKKDSKRTKTGTLIYINPNSHEIPKSKMDR